MPCILFADQSGSKLRALQTLARSSGAPAVAKVSGCVQLAAAFAPPWTPAAAMTRAPYDSLCPPSAAKATPYRPQRSRSYPQKSKAAVLM